MIEPRQQPVECHWPKCHTFTRHPSGYCIEHYPMRALCRPTGGVTYPSSNEDYTPHSAEEHYSGDWGHSLFKRVI